RLQCAKNLKQLGLAVHHFHDKERRLPYGQFLDKFGAGPDSYAWSWLARLLPCIEEGNLSQQGGIPLKTLRQSGVADRQLAVFLCPSDSTSNAGPLSDRGNLDGFSV